MVNNAYLKVVRGRSYVKCFYYTQKIEWKKTFRSGGYVYGTDCCDGITDVHLSSDSPSWICYISVAFCMSIIPQKFFGMKNSKNGCSV